jgi:hypothetical protein
MGCHRGVEEKGNHRPVAEMKHWLTMLVMLAIGCAHPNGPAVDPPLRIEALQVSQHYFAV